MFVLVPWGVPGAGDDVTDPPAALNGHALDRWRRAVIAGFSVGGITVGTFGPRLPALKTELGVTTGTIGLLLACVSVGAMTGLVASTPVHHRLGSRRAVTAAPLLIAVALVVMGVAVSLRSVPLLGAALAALGLGIGVFDVLINVEGSANERAAGRTLMPRMHAAWSIGTAVGAGIGAGCAALGITPAAQFIGEAVLIAVLALGLSPSIPAGSRPTDEQRREGRAERLRQWLACWTDRRLLLIGLVMFGAEVAEGSANSWLTLAVRNDHGETAAVAALFFAAFAAGEGITRIFAGRVVDHLGRVLSVRLTTALGVLGVALFIVGRSPWIVLFGVLLWSVGVSMGFPLGMSAAAEGGSNEVARLSVVGSMGYSANLASPPVIGLLADSTGLLHALWLPAGFLLVAFAVAGSFRPAKP